jgi:hypothetical protein
MNRSPRPRIAASAALIALFIIAVHGFQVSDAGAGGEGGAGVASGGAQARAFVDPSEQVIRLDSGRPQTCFQVEPVDGSFDIHQVFLRSMKLEHLDTNPRGASKIVTIGATLDRDTDHNGVSEIRACFSKADLRRLLMDVGGRSTIVVQVYGALERPGPLNWFEAPVAIVVVGDGSYRLRPTTEADKLGGAR